MKTSDFYYDLPPELIAQTPLDKRDSSRLLHLDRNTGEITHKNFFDILDYLNEGDCLILNDSKVLPARIYGVKEGTEDSKIEFLLLTQKGNNVWEILCKPGKKAKVGVKFTFGNGLLTGEITEVFENGNRLCKFSFNDCKGENIYSILERIGEMPLPPYIKEKLSDGNRYQTVYANEIGSAAAPTAGLHFTKQLLEKIEAKGVKIGFVTLHVGLGTFRPVKVDDITEHEMHSEHYEIPKVTADLINETKAKGGRVICVGTTSCRTLESAATHFGRILPCDEWTNIFIYPGYEFKVMDGLITNFHLPESTLIMLVSAFAGRENVLNAYKTAISKRYRFFSFGDCCLIL